MTEKKRVFVRNISKIAAGSSVVLLMLLAGTSDFRAELQEADEKTREYHESRLISEEEENTLLAATLVAMGISAAGLIMTEKKEKQR